MRTTIVFLSSAFATSLAFAAAAQQAPATSGSTDVASEGFQKAAEQPADDTDSQSAKISAGAFLTAGNSRTLALTGAAAYRVRRAASQFEAAASVNYGESAPDADSDRKRSVENYQGKVRYDHFLADSFATFLSVSGRRDEFQKLDLRLNIDPGLAYYYIEQKEQLLWAELGYDLQHDIRTEDETETYDKTETRHGARAFVGFETRLSEAANFSTSLEYIQSLSSTEILRLNFDAALASKILDDLSLAATFATKYDKTPLEGVEDTDIITAVNLVYTFK